MLPDNWYYAKRLGICLIIGISLAVLFWFIYQSKLYVESKYDTSQLNQSKKASGTPTSSDKNPRKYSFMAFLYIMHTNGSDNCGGTLIDPRNILTAAHCLEGASSVYILLGTDNFQNEGPSAIQLESNEFVLHADYDNTTYDNDIALVYLNDDVQLNDDIDSVSLCDQNYCQLHDFSKAVVAGWGSNDSSQGLSDELLSKDVIIINYSNSVFLTCKYDLCKKLYAIGVFGPCHGDSGGPLLSSNVQIGIVSGGDEKCDSTIPSVYTYIKYYKNWIEINKKKL